MGAVAFLKLNIGDTMSILLKQYRMAIACLNDEGEPDFVFVIVKCTEDQCDNGLDRKAAKKWAKERGDVSNPIPFNCERDCVGEHLVNAFTWESASVIEVNQPKRKAL